MYTKYEKNKYAKALRRHQTRAEKSLVYLYLFGFRPQVVVSGYIVDWYHTRIRLAIELDGEVHKGQKAKDKRRTKHLQAKGIMVIRFKNKSAMHYRLTTAFIIITISIARQLYLWVRLST